MTTVNRKRFRSARLSGRRLGNAWAGLDAESTNAILFRAGITLPDGRAVQFFVNRSSGLIVADVIDKDGRGGREILRYRANEVDA